MTKPLTCFRCPATLTGGLDTFGDRGYEMCWDCYADTNSEAGQSYYGLAPHHHDLEQTGSFVGSTVFDAADDDTFTPDPDAPGCGVWTPKLLPGWR